MSTEQESQNSLPAGEASSFLVVGNYADDTDFGSAIREGHTSSGANPINPGESHMVLLSRSRFLHDLLSFTVEAARAEQQQQQQKGDDEEGVEVVDDNYKNKTGEELLSDEAVWKKIFSQTLLDIPRQDVFVKNEQIRSYEEFMRKVQVLLDEAAEVAINIKPVDPKTSAAILTPATAAQNQVPQQPGWVGWGVNIALRTATLGLVGTATFTGDNSVDAKNASNLTKNLPPALTFTLKTPEGSRTALRMAVSCAQQGALAIMLDGVSAQFHNFNDVAIGEVSDTDVLPPNAPTRRSCIAVNTTRVGSPVVEVRKLLRLFRILPSGNASTMFFVHTLLTVPLLPQGRHEVCLEWKVTTPPVPPLPPVAVASSSTSPSTQKTQQQQTQQQQQQQPAAIPLILAEQLPPQNETEAKTTRVLSDEEIARKLQVEFDDEEERMRIAQVERDLALARTFATNNNNNSAAARTVPDEEGLGAISDVSREQEQTLLEEALNARRHRNKHNHRYSNNSNSRRNNNNSNDNNNTRKNDAADGVSPVVNNNNAPENGNGAEVARVCACLGASSGFHRAGCVLRTY